MGGSSLAALVMGALLPGDGTRLHALDTTSPVTIAKVLEGTDPATTIHLVSSKSGGTVEPNALYAIFRDRADSALGRDAAGLRFVAITDPGSSLERLAAEDGMRACVLSPPTVGGRYSALTPFGLVPAALLGADVRALVDHALEVERSFTHGVPDTGLVEHLAAALDRGSDKLVIGASADLRVFGLWIEQLVAESLGKSGQGIVPIIAEGEPTAPRRADESLVTLIRTSNAPSAEQVLGETFRMEIGDPYELGGWFVLWEYSVALLGAIIGVNPFDQPNVAEAKAATNAVLEGTLEPPSPQGAVDGIHFTFAGRLPQPGHVERSAATVLAHALAEVGDHDYLALLAYLPDDDALLAPLKEALSTAADAIGAPACFELGPRYLHSTGQLHKGGPDSGVFVMVTTRDTTDIDIPGWPFGLRALHMAQAEGDLTALSAHGRRVLRLDLPDASADSIAALAKAVRDGAARP
jgi:transaldolase/glucose-6-phosphate isomerase